MEGHLYGRLVEHLELGFLQLGVRSGGFGLLVWTAPFTFCA